MCQQVLDRLWRNVFAAGGDNQALLPVGDFEIPLFVEAADVTGMQPSLLVDRLGGGGRIVVVATHHVRSARKYLAIVIDPDFDVEKGKSDGADPGTLQRVGGDDRR